VFTKQVSQKVGRATEAEGYQATYATFKALMRALSEWLMAYHGAKGLTAATPEQEADAIKLAAMGETLAKNISAFNFQLGSLSWNRFVTALSILWGTLVATVEGVAELAVKFGKGTMGQLAFLSGNWIYFAMAIGAVWLLAPRLIGSLGRRHAPEAE